MVFSHLWCARFSIYSAEQTHSSYTLQNSFRWFHSERILLSAKTIVQLYCWHFSHWKWPFFALIRQLRLSAFSMEWNFYEITVASSSRGISCERHIWVEKLSAEQTVQVLFESVRITVKDRLAQDGWLVLLCPASKGRRVSQSLLKKLIVCIPGLPCEYNGQGYLWQHCRDFHDH